MTPTLATPMRLIDCAGRSRGAEAAADRARCSTCNLRDLCLPRGLDDEGMAAFAEMVSTHKRVKRGESLYRTGDAFNAIYAVRMGFFKSRVLLDDGRDQVTGFHMPGEIVGMDGIGTERHTTDEIALEDSEVCVIPYSRLEEPVMQRQLHKAMSRELVRDQGVMMLLGTMRAEERIATFLLSLSQRYAARGFSSSEFHLRMTRDEIGSYLGLSLETVSRLLSRFAEEGVIAVRQKHIVIRHVEALRSLVAGRHSGDPASMACSLRTMA